eukprot:TRINITY_DN264_c0_g1_i5.p1 TRINITY_DN264_c0_g1~~TRINITY_DN264_c0_g1_i5.p1  ORF type:complete len:1300 (-),score=151.73 TRINITY_DN264_c0_g1_i5:889-4788(-)
MARQTHFKNIKFEHEHLIADLHTHFSGMGHYNQIVDTWIDSVSPIQFMLENPHDLQKLHGDLAGEKMCWLIPSEVDKKILHEEQRSGLPVERDLVWPSVHLDSSFRRSFAEVAAAIDVSIVPRDLRYYDERNQEFLTVNGYTHTELQTLLKDVDFKSEFRKCFSFERGTDGEIPNVYGDFGKFLECFGLRDVPFQRLKNMKFLMGYIVKRYEDAFVSYVELSNSASDTFLRPWVMFELLSEYYATRKFLDLRFLASFNRNNLKLIPSKDLGDVLNGKSPSEVVAEVKNIRIYSSFIQTLEKINNVLPFLPNWQGRLSKFNLRHVIVGFDYMGDERGRPYCPFFLACFKAFAEKWVTVTGRRFGFRIHFGEAVPMNQPSQHDRQFSNHMLAGLTVIADLLETCHAVDIRLGHGWGIAFVIQQLALGQTLSTDLHEKLEKFRSLLHSHQMLAIEVNATSNRVLVQAPDKMFFNDESAIKALHESHIYAVLGTDDDGIIDVQCAEHSGQHKSLHGEICDAYFRERSGRVSFNDQPSLARNTLTAYRYRFGQRACRRSYGSVTAKATEKSTLQLAVEAPESEVSGSVDLQSLDQVKLANPALTGVTAMVQQLDNFIMQNADIPAVPSLEHLASSVATNARTLLDDGILAMAKKVFDDPVLSSIPLLKTLLQGSVPTNESLQEVDVTMSDLKPHDTFLAGFRLMEFEVSGLISSTTPVTISGDSFVEDVSRFGKTSIVEALRLVLAPSEPRLPRGFARDKKASCLVKYSLDDQDVCVAVTFDEKKTNYCIDKRRVLKEQYLQKLKCLRAHFVRFVMVCSRSDNAWLFGSDDTSFNSVGTVLTNVLRAHSADVPMTSVSTLTNKHAVLKREAEQLASAHVLLEARTSYSKDIQALQREILQCGYWELFEKLGRPFEKGELARWRRNAASELKKLTTAAETAACAAAEVDSAATDLAAHQLQEARFARRALLWQKYIPQYKLTWDNLAAISDWFKRAARITSIDGSILPASLNCLQQITASHLTVGTSKTRHDNVAEARKLVAEFHRMFGWPPPTNHAALSVLLAECAKQAIKVKGDQLRESLLAIMKTATVGDNCTACFRPLDAAALEFAVQQLSASVAATDGIDELLARHKKLPISSILASDLFASKETTDYDNLLHEVLELKRHVERNRLKPVNMACDKASVMKLLSFAQCLQPFPRKHLFRSRRNTKIVWRARWSCSKPKQTPMPCLLQVRLLRGLPNFAQRTSSILWIISRRNTKMHSIKMWAQSRCFWRKSKLNSENCVQNWDVSYQPIQKLWRASGGRK